MAVSVIISLHIGFIGSNWYSKYYHNTIAILELDCGFTHSCPWVIEVIGHHRLCISDLQGYKVYYTLTPDLPISLWTVHPVDSGQLTTLNNLLTNRTYTIRILAFTAAGDGPMSEHVRVRTLNSGGRKHVVLSLLWFTLCVCVCVCVSVWVERSLCKLSIKLINAQLVTRHKSIIYDESRRHILAISRRFKDRWHL